MVAAPVEGKSPLAGRVVFVAGATGPIGRAVCTSMAQLGGSVAVHYHRRRAEADEIIGAMEGDHLSVCADLSQRDGVDAAVTDVEQALGCVAILVNAAHLGQMVPRGVAATSAAELAGQLGSVEVHAGLCARVVPAMRTGGWGRIVYVAGALMARPAPGFGAYAASKAAASVLTRYLALEEGRAGITANIVAPGRVVDPSNEEELDDERQALARKLQERMALPTFPTPAQVAGVVAGLVGPSGDAITGQTMWVTGGEPING